MWLPRQFVVPTSCRQLQHVATDSCWGWNAMPFFCGKGCVHCCLGVMDHFIVVGGKLISTSNRPLPSFPQPVACTCTISQIKHVHWSYWISWLVIIALSFPLPKWDFVMVGYHLHITWVANYYFPWCHSSTEVTTARKSLLDWQPCIHTNATSTCSLAILFGGWGLGT